MTTGSRMKERRKEIGVPVETIANALGVSVATVYRYENGDIEKVPGTVLEPLARVLQTTPAYLMGWDDTTPEQPPHPSLKPFPATRKVPRLGTIACGEPILATENHEAYDDVPEFVHCDFTLQCKGDSMINARILDGDTVCIRQQSTVENGEIAAVLIGDEATLKRVYLYPDSITLAAENPRYRPIIYSGEEMNQCRILGKAVYFISKLDR